MKEIIKTLGIIILVFLIATFIYRSFPSEKFQQFKTRSSDLSGEKVGEFNLGDSLNSQDIVSNQFDRAATSGDMKYSYDGGEKDYNHIKLQDGIIAVSRQDKGRDILLGYMVYKKDFKTEKGVGIGGGMEDIVDAYGEDYYTMRLSDKEFIGYVDKENDLTIRFHLKDGQISRFDLNYRQVDKELNL